MKIGTWGVELYQNDISLDVKNEFEELYNAGKRSQEITNKLIEDYKNIMGDINEEPLFWFALADTQWDFGVLQPFVKKNALCWIDQNCNMDNLQITDISAKVKKNFLYDLQAKLLSPQPPPKKSAKKRTYKCQWNLGDVFAYQLESDLAKQRGLYGRYFLIQKVDEDIVYPGHIVPIVYVKITNNTNIPLSVEEYDQLDYVQVWFTKYEDRFLPIDMRCPQDDVAKKSKINYKVDEYGFLPQYRVKLLNTSQKVIPAKLIYVGNIAPATYPKNEFVPHSKENIVTASWKQFDETFETKMIKRYCGHNLRELGIYTNKNI